MDPLHIDTTGSGPDLFLVHGWGMNAVIWNGLRKELESRYRVTCVDLPGHGRSTPGGNFDLETASNALLAAAPPHATWVAWSLGGMLALHAARQAPERIRQLALIASSPRFVTAPDWADAIDPGVLEQFLSGLQQDYRGSLNRFLALQVRGSEHANTTLRDLRQQLFVHGEPDAAALISGLTILRDADLRSQLAALRLPICFIMGERDTLMPCAAASAAHTLAPHADVHIIPGAGHAPFLSHPQAFLDILLTCLQPAAQPASGARPHGG